MITFVRPNGEEIELNDHPANLAFAEKAGWKPKEEAKPKRKSTPKPAEDE
jgi:hypothetical protein